MLSHRTVVLAVLCAIALLFPVRALDTAQVFTGTPYQTQYFPGVDTLWLGATMYTQVDGDSIVVQFIYSAAYWANVLYFMDPATGDTVRVFGFDEEGLNSRCPVNPRTGLVEVRKYIGSFAKNTELVFMLRTVKLSGVRQGEYCNDVDCGPRYTGLNNPAKSPWYSSKPPYGGSQFAAMDDHPWAIMTELDSTQVTSLPHPCPGSGQLTYQPTRGRYGVLFSFEDGANSTYDDMVFLVLGAKLTPAKIREVRLNAFPQGPICAGDSVAINAEVWVDTTIGTRDTALRKPQYDSLVTWEMTGPPGNPPLRRGLGPAPVNVFFATEAYDTFTVTATVRDPISGSVIQSARLEIPVKACYPDHVSIEPDSTVQDLRNDRPLDVVTITSGETTAVVYAYVRDEFGNYIDKASAAVWTSESAGVATVAALPGQAWQGIIARMGSGSVRIRAAQGQLTPDTVQVNVEPLPSVALVSAVTGDADGDGYLDRITLSYDSLVSLPGSLAAAGFAVKAGTAQWQIDSVRTRAGTVDSVVILYLHEQTGGDMQTGLTPAITVPQIGLASPVADHASLDGAGPVIKRAVLVRPPLQGRSADTLLITYSEPVLWPLGPCPPGEAVNYYDSASVNAAAFSGISAGDITSAGAASRVCMTNGFVVAPLDDSVQLMRTYRVTDAAGNMAPQNGRFAAIEWGSANALRIAAFNNPFQAGGGASLPPAVQDYYRDVLTNAGGSVSTPGVLAAVKTVKPLKRRANSSYGSALIYDAVGNVVVSNLRLDQASAVHAYDYGVFWDGRNRNGRFVGGGTYLMVVTAEDIDEKRISQRVKVGVKVGR